MYLHSFLVILTALTFLPSSIISQNEKTTTNAIQLTIGLANTLHYQQPVKLSYCSAGCFLEKQEARPAVSIALSYYKSILPRHSLMAGFGIFQVRYWEKGMGYNSMINLVPYERTYELFYQSASVGYRFTPYPNQTFSPFIESNAFYEWSEIGGPFFSLNGVSLQLCAGVSWNITSRISLILDGFYKSAIMDYYQDGYYHNTYYPFAYGLDGSAALKF